MIWYLVVLPARRWTLRRLWWTFRRGSLSWLWLGSSFPSKTSFRSLSFSSFSLCRILFRCSCSCFRRSRVLDFLISDLVLDNDLVSDELSARSNPGSEKFNWLHRFLPGRKLHHQLYPGPSHYREKSCLLLHNYLECLSPWPSPIVIVAWSRTSIRQHDPWFSPDGTPRLWQHWMSWPSRGSSTCE